MNARAVGSTPDQKPSEAWVVRVVGDLDLASAPGLRNRIARAADDPTREVVVDLSGVSFLDCAGLDALLTAQDQLGSRLSLRWPSIAVLWLIELTRLHVVFGSPDDRIGSPGGGGRALPSQRLPR
jgi:anti-anti-sigma factor